MATYEVLEPGGHARLVSDTKGYANRASGVGTTQIADESVTSAKLADDVTDALDNVESFTDPMNKNGLHGELAEGTLLTADDVYAAPPRDVDVYGVSTQAGTPTPDAPVPIESVDDLTLHVCGKNLFDVDHVHALLLSAATYSVSDDSITVTKTAQSAACVILVELPTIVGTSVTYTLAANTTSSGAMLCLGYCDSNGSNRTQISRSDAMKNPVITASVNVPDGKVAAAWLYPDFANATISSCVFSNIQLELGTTATAYAPYVGQSIPIPLSNHVGRSLPSGTRDVVTLSYIEPSTEHEGWGVYSKTLVQNVGTYVFPDGFAFSTTPTDLGDGWYRYVRYNTISNFKSGTASGYCDRTIFYADSSAKYEHIYISGASVLFVTQLATSADANAALIGGMMQYPCTPQTHDLGTIELPVNPAPDLTAWADGGSAQSTMAMKYERDVNIVISNMMSVIADAATS